MSPVVGHIFDVCGKVGGAQTPHPHVAVGEIGKDYVMLPAYTSGGYELEAYKRVVLLAAGVRADQACVELDNARHVRFHDGRPGNLATWVVERFDRWPRRDLPPAVGEMDAAGVRAVLEALVVLSAAAPGRFSQNLLHRLHQNLDEVKARIASGQ